MDTKIKAAKLSIRDVMNFPKEGILFKDITTLLKSSEHLTSVSDAIVNYYKDKGITKVVGLESRGFILGGLLAYKLGAGFVPIRKPGKLPSKVYSEKYELEYGFDEIQIHRDALSENDVVLLHDDLLATGGTAAAATELISRFNVKDIHINFLIELDFLKGREALSKQFEAYSVFHF